jgi:prevent-host-death family protein
MKKAGIAELRNNLSRYLDHVRAGGTVVVCDRDMPVARIVPIDGGRARAKDADEARLARLERKGLIRRGKGDLLKWLEQRKLPKGRLKRSLVEAIIEERESGW